MESDAGLFRTSQIISAVMLFWQWQSVMQWAKKFSRMMGRLSGVGTLMLVPTVEYL